MVLDLDTPQAVTEAEQRIRSRLRRLFPKARVDGFAVQKMVHRPGSQELMAGVVSDPVFGPVILFGQGGPAVDIIDDLVVYQLTIDGYSRLRLIQKSWSYR